MISIVFLSILFKKYTPTFFKLKTINIFSLLLTFNEFPSRGFILDVNLN